MKVCLSPSVFVKVFNALFFLVLLQCIVILSVIALASCGVIPEEDSHVGYLCANYAGLVN